MWHYAHAEHVRFHMAAHACPQRTREPGDETYTHSVHTTHGPVDQTSRFGLFVSWKTAFSVVIRWRTYARLAYLILSLPLGLLYFAFLTTAIAAGTGLIVVGIGLPILLGVLGASWLLLGIERELAVQLLGVEIPLVQSPEGESGGLIGQLRAHLGDRGTWKALAFLLAKLPLGIVSFTVSLLAIAIASTLIAAPVTYWATDIDLGIWTIDQFWEAMLAFFLGLPACLGAMHLINAMGVVYGRFARAAMTGSARR